jgi:hypothetical protein
MVKGGLIGVFVVRGCELVGNDGELLLGSSQEKWRVASTSGSGVVRRGRLGALVWWLFDVCEPVFESAQGVVDGPLVRSKDAVRVAN